MPKGCVKKVYSRTDAEKEAENLQTRYTRFLWSVYSCAPCRGFHIQREELESKRDLKPNWTGECENCGASPIVPATGMCGPCTFGQADTAGGNW
jgi:hypothetical protein